MVESWSPFAQGKIFQNEILKTIAKAHNTTVAKVCLRWVIQHEVIVIPKSTTNERIEANINVFDFELTDKEMTLINELPEFGFSREHPYHWPDRV